MNRWVWIRRIRGPAYLILFGITALLNQEGILSFGRSWPLYLILAGILLLAERAAATGVLHLPPYSDSTSIAPISALAVTSSSVGVDAGSADKKWGA